jgi:hypothetical protein
MSLHGSPRHVQLSGDLRVIATLKQQFSDLPLPRTHSDRFVFHPIPPSAALAKVLAAALWKTWAASFQLPNLSKLVISFFRNS